MRKTLSGYCGLQYIRILRVPVGDAEVDEASLTDEVRGNCSFLVADAVIRSLPIRGLEVKALRKCMNLSLLNFGKLLGVRDVTILRWEQGETERLAVVNEIACRVLVGNRLGISISSSEICSLLDVEPPKQFDLKYSEIS